MDDKELSDPMNNVSLIKGNLAVLFLIVCLFLEKLPNRTEGNDLAVFCSS